MLSLLFHCDCKCWFLWFAFSFIASFNYSHYGPHKALLLKTDFLLLICNILSVLSTHANAWDLVGFTPNFPTVYFLGHRPLLSCHFVLWEVRSMTASAADKQLSFLLTDLCTKLHFSDIFRGADVSRVFQSSWRTQSETQRCGFASAELPHAPFSW